MVWFERQSLRSRYGCVRVEMFTTAYRLTESGQSEIHRAFDDGEVSAHDGRLGRVPEDVLEDLARKVYRAATRLGNSEPNRTKVLSISGGNQGLFQTVRTALRAVSA